MLKRIHHLWRRAVCCTYHRHRETVEMTGGSLLRLRCVDCGGTVALGFVVRGSNKIHMHWPWERADEA